MILKKLKNPKVLISMIFVVTSMVVSGILLFAIIFKPYTTKPNNLYVQSYQVREVGIGEYIVFNYVPLNIGTYMEIEKVQKVDDKKVKVYMQVLDNNSLKVEWKYLYSTYLYTGFDKNGKGATNLIRLNTFPKKIDNLTERD